LSIREEWQLVAHAPKELSPAEGAVAGAIARRIRLDRDSERIPQRTLLEESVGVSSKRTVQRALAELQILGVIRVDSSGAGSRKADLITWLLECPADCDKDHAKGNARRTKESATRPNPDTSTRPNPDTPLRSIKKRDRGVLGFVEEALVKVQERTEQQEALFIALSDPEQRSAIRTRAEHLAVRAEQNPENYLAQIALTSPHRLLPKAVAQEPPDFSYLSYEEAEAALRKWHRDQQERAAS